MSRAVQVVGVTAGIIGIGVGLILLSQDNDTGTGVVAVGIVVLCVMSLSVVFNKRLSTPGTNSHAGRSGSE